MTNTTTKSILMKLALFTVMLVSISYGGTLKVWLMFEYPYVSVFLGILAKILLAVMPLVITYYIYNENKKLMNSIDHNLPLPSSVIKKYGKKIHVKDFNKEELYLVGVIALLAGIFWAIGLSYYLLLNY